MMFDNTSCVRTRASRFTLFEVRAHATIENIIDVGKVFSSKIGLGPPALDGQVGLQWCMDLFGLQE